MTDPPTQKPGAPPPPSLVSHVRAVHGHGLGDAVARVVEPFGGWQNVVRPGERIAVKINLLRGADPSQAVTTHPETLRHVLRGLRAAGAVPFVADSPGGPNPAVKIARIWRMTGVSDVCAEEGVELCDVDSDHAELACPNGKLFRTFVVGRAFLEADGIVQVGIVKTHVLMRLTGGVKLAFGCVPGIAKAQLHVRVSRREDFADMLLDLYEALQPRFTIMDGILAMEGQGPGGGRARELGSLFAAADAIALDVAIADRTAHARSKLYTLSAAADRGLIDLGRPYELAGDPIEPMLDFVPATETTGNFIPRPFRGLARRSTTSRPRLVNPANCTRCGECEAICGARAISMNPLPRFDDEICVRCYACAEICPSGALDVEVPALARLVSRLDMRRRRHATG